ncbi:MAG: RNA polymerase sigma factor [Planctomycetes bacterium]|nr:RNA polymerase sigma factor [Planctomycetota bacterium]
MDVPPIDPLTNASHASWSRVVASANPPALLVAIRRMMGPALQSRLEADDILQETLIHAWRDRTSCEWRGVGAFRRWLLEIARNRIRDQAGMANAGKRGQGRERRHADLRTTLVDEVYAGPTAETTPSRLASDREMADHMARALDCLPDEWREVVRLRLFEELELHEIATALGLGVEGVRYRFRHGADAYQRALRQSWDVGTDAPPS